jgi:hypothetical protein
MSSFSGPPTNIIIIIIILFGTGLKIVFLCVLLAVQQQNVI